MEMRGTVLPVQQVRDVLAESSNPRDSREGTEIDLLEPCPDEWRGRFALRGGTSARGGLGLLMDLVADGAIWTPNGPSPHRDWQMLIIFPDHYPISQASVLFVDPVPFQTNTCHRDCLPDAARLDPEYHEFVRRGHGSCCYMSRSDWSTDFTTHNLALVVWQLSRLITYSTFRGEGRATLNSKAFDHAMRLRDQGRLPLGPPLPFPIRSVTQLGAAGVLAQEAGDEGEGFEFID